MVENAPQQGWDPSRDRLARWPLIEHWAGLRREIKQAWLHLAEIAPAGSARYFVGVGDLADGFRVMDYTSIWRRLTTLARLGLIRWESAYQTYGMVQASRPSEPVQWAITIEMFDPLTVDRKPVGRAVRVPKIGSGDFDRQRNLFGDSEPRTLRMWTDDSDACEDPTDGEQPQAVAVVARQPLAVIGRQPQAEPQPLAVVAVQPQAVVAKTPPHQTMDPPESVPQCPAGARAFFDSSISSISSKGSSRDDFCGGDEGDEGQGGGSGSGDPVQALCAADFERRREEVVERANAISRRVWRSDQRSRMNWSDRSLLLKAVFLASAKPCPPYGLAWLDDAVGRVCRSKDRKKLDRPGAYLHRILSKSVKQAGRDLNCDLASLGLASVIPGDLLASQPGSQPSQPGPGHPARASPVADRNVRPPSVEVARAEAREVVAAARAAIREANRVARAARLSNPQSLAPNPSKGT
jgi:hypothetical protein